MMFSTDVEPVASPIANGSPSPPSAQTSETDVPGVDRLRVAVLAQPTARLACHALGAELGDRFVLVDTDIEHADIVITSSTAPAAIVTLKSRLNALVLVVSVAAPHTATAKEATVVLNAGADAYASNPDLAETVAYVHALARRVDKRR